MHTYRRLNEMASSLNRSHPHRPFHLHCGSFLLSFFHFVVLIAPAHFYANHTRSRTYARPGSRVVLSISLYVGSLASRTSVLFLIFSYESHQPRSYFCQPCSFQHLAKRKCEKPEHSGKHYTQSENDAEKNGVASSGTRYWWLI